MLLEIFIVALTNKTTYVQCLLGEPEKTKEEPKEESEKDKDTAKEGSTAPEKVCISGTTLLEPRDKNSLGTTSVWSEGIFEVYKCN